MKKIKIFGTSIAIAKRRFFSWRPDVWSSSSPILVTGTGINLMQRDRHVVYVEFFVESLENAWTCVEASWRLSKVTCFDTCTRSLCVKSNPKSPKRTWDWMKFWAGFEIKLVSYPQSQKDTWEVPFGEYSTFIIKYTKQNRGYTQSKNFNWWSNK